MNTWRAPGLHRLSGWRDRQSSWRCGSTTPRWCSSGEPSSRVCMRSVEGDFRLTIPAFRVESCGSGQDPICRGAARIGLRSLRDPRPSRWEAVRGVLASHRLVGTSSRTCGSAPRFARGASSLAKTLNPGGASGHACGNAKRVRRGKRSARRTRSVRGAARIRTGDKGFAVLCLTTWPRRQKRVGGGQRKLPPPDHESGKPDSNRRPQPWQGCALPTELFPHVTRERS